MNPYIFGITLSKRMSKYQYMDNTNYCVVVRPKNAKMVLKKKRSHGSLIKHRSPKLKLSGLDLD